MKRSIMISALIISGVLMSTGCKAKQYKEIDLSSTHTTAATEAVKETMASTTTASTEEETTTGSVTKEPVSSIEAAIETYHSEGSNQITIQYPVISQMKDTSKQEAVNKLLKDNALAINEQFKSLDSNITASINCKVVSLDRRRVTVVYTGNYRSDGGAYPVNVFYTNTVDLSEVKSLGFDDYSDAYTMAGYVMSDDCEFYNVSGDLKEALLAYRKTQSLEEYTDLFRKADFPLADGADTLPESFSYVDQSVLYFSIPVPHALGDYALVTFNLDGK